MNFYFIRNNKYSLLIIATLIRLVSSISIWLASGTYFYGTIVYGWFADASLEKQFEFGLSWILINPMVYFAPFAEEFIFRYPLAKKVNRYLWCLSIASFFWLTYYFIQLTFFDGFDPYMFQLLNEIARNQFLQLFLVERNNEEIFGMLILGLVTGSLIYLIRAC